MVTTDGGDVRLEPEEIETFGRDGVVMIRGLIPPEMVAELRPGYEEAVAGRLDVPAWAGRIAPGKILQLANPSQSIPGWQGHPYLARLEAAARQLVGDDVAYGYDQLIYKPAHNPTEVLWHQDAGYGWPGEAGRRSVTCWLALDVVSLDMGCMQFIPGSHRQGIVEHRSAGDRNPINNALVAEVDATRAISMAFGPGDATFHHGRTLHYTGPNLTDRPRRGVTTHFWPRTV